MKKLVCIATALVTLTTSIVSCAPEAINNDDEQLIEKHEVEIPTDKL